MFRCIRGRWCRLSRKTRTVLTRHVHCEDTRHENSPHSAEGSSATDSGRGASDEGCDGRPTRYIPPPPPPASLPRPAYWTVHHHHLHQQPQLQPPSSTSASSSSSSSHTLPSRSLLRSARKQTAPGASSALHQYPTSTRSTVRFKGLNTTPEEDADELEMTTSVATSSSTMTLPTVNKSSGSAAACDGLPRNGSSCGARDCAPPPPVRQQRVDHAATSTPSRIVLPQSLSAASAAASTSTTSRSPCIFVTTSRSLDV